MAFDRGLVGVSKSVVNGVRVTFPTSLHAASVLKDKNAVSAC